MNLVPTQAEHLETLKTWFPDLGSAQVWGGPDIRYPFTDVAFLEDIRWQQMTSYSMLGEDNELTGFGQYYEKEGRCHLARLVVAPTHRSKGFGYQFIQKLMRVGMSDLGVNECSLFVMSSNKNAINCYTALNFIQSRYPPGQKYFSDIVFMVCKH
ncbi:MAG: GNAT family N-acetyltransferase [Xanthomonadales bacterium]|nr:GNAT family N-acetyltransferase [Xanthomonadales bacterium]